MRGVSDKLNSPKLLCQFLSRFSLSITCKITRWVSSIKSQWTVCYFWFSFDIKYEFFHCAGALIGSEDQKLQLVFFCFQNQTLFTADLLADSRRPPTALFRKRSFGKVFLVSFMHWNPDSLKIQKPLLFSKSHLGRKRFLSDFFMMFFWSIFSKTLSVENIALKCCCGFTVRIMKLKLWVRWLILLNPWAQVLLRSNCHDFCNNRTNVCHKAYFGEDPIRPKMQKSF